MTTTTETAPLTLAETERACPACGRAVNVSPAALTAGGRHVARFEGGSWRHDRITGGHRVGPGPVVRFPIEPPELHGPARLVAGGHRPLVWVEMARCATCARREEHAAVMVAAAPGVINRCGTVAVDQLVAALDGLAALGQPVPPVASPQVVAGLLAHLTEPGRLASWSARVSPHLTASGLDRVAQPAPWAHLTAADRSALRQGHAHLLAERVAALAPPVAVPAPGAGVMAGCAFCGIGTVNANAVKVLRAGGVGEAQRHEWRTVNVTDTHAVGAHPSPGDRSAELALCRPCAAAVDGAGVVGPTALETAFLRHLASTGEANLGALVREHAIPGLAGWAGLALDARKAGRAPVAPNTKPWAHVRVAS